MIGFIVALIVIMNPIGNLAIYIALIDIEDQKNCNQNAKICAVAIFIILLISLWIGWPLLNFFGISIGAFKVAGGIVILGIALSMLKGATHSHHHGDKTANASAENKELIGVVPMAIPVIAGPGAMTVLISKAHDFSFTQMIMATIVCLIISLFFWILLKFTPKVAEHLGEEGLRIVSRVMGLILAAIAVEIAASGIGYLYHFS